MEFFLFIVVFILIPLVAGFVGGLAAHFLLRGLTADTESAK